MTVALFRDPGEGDHVAELPAWIAPKTGDRYWHQPRSASTTGDRLHVRFWCGQACWVDDRRLRETPPDDLRCGTCIGRRAGFDRADGAVFRPRDHWAPPIRCPGNSDEPPDFKTCLACGEKVQAARGINAWGLAKHRPGPAFTERLRPCPHHGWQHIHERSGRFVCSAWRCEWEAR